MRHLEDINFFLVCLCLTLGCLKVNDCFGQAATGLTFTGLGGDPTSFCMNVPFQITLSPVQTTDTITWPPVVRPIGYCNSSTTSAAGGVHLPSSFDVSCSRAQTYLITVNTASGAALSIKIQVDNYQDLYGWHAVAVIPPPSGSPANTAVIDKAWQQNNLTVRLWIENREITNSSTETVPNRRNAQLTNVFQRLGVSPRLETNFRDQYDIFFYCDPTIAPTYDFGGGFFVFNCPRTANDCYGYYNYNLTGDVAATSANQTGPTTYNQLLPLEYIGYGAINPPVELTYQQKVQVIASGQPDYFGFTVASPGFTLTRPKFTIPLLTAGATTLTWNQASNLRYEPCNSNFIVGLQKDGGIYYTNDEFQTSQPLTITLGTLTSANLNEVQVTKSYIYFLTDIGALYALNRTTTNNIATLITPTSSVLASPLIGLKVPEWCTSPSNTAARDVFVAWTTSAFIMSTTDGSPLTYNAVSTPTGVLNSNAATGGSIIDMALDRTPGRQACHVLVSSSAGVFLQYYYRLDKSNASRPVDNWLTPGYNGGAAVISTPDMNARIYTLLHGEPRVVIAGSSGLYRVTPTIILQYTLTNSVPVNSTVTAPIHMVQFARSGNIFFLTVSSLPATPTIYLGDANSAYLTAIKSNVPPDVVMRLDRFDQPWLVQMPNGSTVQYLDTTTQLLNDGGTVAACPYAIFDCQGDELYEGVDIGSTYTVVTSLWIPVANGGQVDLEVVVSDPLENNHNTGNDLNMTILTDRQEDGGLIRVTKTIIIQNTFTARHGHGEPAELPTARTSPMTTVTVHPTLVQPSCTERSQRVFFAQGTCPAGLTIQLIPQSPCATPYPASFTVPSQYLGDISAKQPVTPPSGLQCDAPSYHTNYVPILGLYYFGTLIENVTVDFYLFEENWRTDFTYLETETEAGCLRGAQTISSIPQCQFAPVLVQPSHGPYACWGPSTYRKCFTSPGALDSAPNPTKPYQILNATGGNAVVFPTDHAPVYVFVAQVLEPNYSFCNLATQFVVVPVDYGDTPDPLIPVYVFFASVGALLVFFWVVYSIYAVSWNENRVGFEMLEKQTVPCAWHLLTSGEHKLLFTGSDGRRRVYLPDDAAELKVKAE